MKKTIVLLMIITVVSKILGFSRDLTLSYFYGATSISDVYLISIAIPTVILAMVGKGVYTALIPLLTRIENQEGPYEADKFTNYILNAFIIFCLMLFILGEIFSEPIVKIFATGFEGETLQLAVLFTRITLAGVLFSGIAYVLSAYLQVKEFFIISAVIGIPANVVVLCSFFIGANTSLVILPIGYLLSMLSQFLLLIYYLRRNKFVYRFGLNIKNSNMRMMLMQSFPVIVGSSAIQINLLIDRTIASEIDSGGISALNYANTLNLFVAGIIASSLSTVIYSRFSKYAADKNLSCIKKQLPGAISSISLIVIPTAVFYMCFAEPIIELIFGRGKFDSAASYMTSSALFFYSIGLIGYCTKDIFINVFYSLQNVKTPILNAMGVVILNISLNLLLSKYLGIGGLALATSLSSIICSVFLLVKLQQVLGELDIKSILAPFVKIVFSSLIMGGVSLLVYNLLFNSMSLAVSLVFSVIIGLCMYLVIISLMKVKEAKFILNMVNTRLVKMKN